MHIIFSSDQDQTSKLKISGFGFLGFNRFHSYFMMKSSKVARLRARLMNDFGLGFKKVKVSFHQLIGL